MRLFPFLAQLRLHWLRLAANRRTLASSYSRTSLTKHGFRRDYVSIILPVYNQGNLLRDAIESIISQTYRHWHLVVINDGSTDNTHFVLEEYLSHPQIVVYSQANRKLPAALNAGFSKARGEFWTWTSADNILLPTMLETLVSYLRTHADTDMVFADYYAIDDRGNALKDPHWRKHNRPELDTGYIKLPRNTRSLNVVQDNFIGPCFLYRGTIGKIIGPYDNQLGVEDYDYWMRINAHFKISHVGKRVPLYKYRVHDNTLSAAALQLGIYDRVAALMEYERERAAFYTRAYTLRSSATQGRSSLSTNHNTPNEIHVKTFPNPSVAQCLAIKALEPCVIVVYLTEATYNYTALYHLRNCSHVLIVTAHNSLAYVCNNILGLTAVHGDTSCADSPLVRAFIHERQLLAETRTDILRSTHSIVLQAPPMRVLLQVDSFIAGGMENVVIELAQVLRGKGHHVTLLVRGHTGPALEVAQQKGLSVIINPSITRSSYETILRDLNIDVVNAHYSWFGAEICKNLNIPFYQTLHNSYTWLDKQQQTLLKQLDRFTTSYFCVSLSAMRYSQIVLGLDILKMRLLPNGVAVYSEIYLSHERDAVRNTYGIGQDHVLYINIANIALQKNQIALIRAFARLVCVQPKARLALIQPVEENWYYSRLIEEIQSQGLNDFIIWLPFIHEPEKYYSMADVFVLPSHWEGWSLAVAEAYNAGLPCVVTDVGSAYEFAEDPYVLVIPPPFGDQIRLVPELTHTICMSQSTDFEEQLASSMQMASALPKRQAASLPIKVATQQSAFADYETAFVESRNLVSME